MCIVEKLLCRRWDMEFVESYMKFGFDDECFYRIEKSSALSEYVKPCEFIILQDSKLCFIEAKSSSPSPGKEDFDKFIGEIVQKFEDSILLYNAVKMKRHGEEASSEIPSNLNTANEDIRYRLYLVIHGHKSEWMPPIQDELRNKLRHILNAWNIKDIDVQAVNQDDARNKGLIKDFFPTDELYKLENKSTEEKQTIAKNWLMNK